MNFENVVKRIVFPIVSVILILAVLISLFVYFNSNSGSSELDEENISELEKSNVSIFCGNNVGEWLYSDNASVGSGFIIGDGLVMTSYHNLLDSEGNLAENCFVLTYDNGFYSTGGIYTDPDFDIAIIHFSVPEGREYPPSLEISDRKPAVNEKVYCISTPKALHLRGTVTNGNVTKLDINGLANQYLMMTDLPLSPGCSGSPIVDKDNKVIGMNAFKSTDFGTEGLSFALYSDKLLKVMKDYDDLVAPKNNKAKKIAVEFETSDKVSKGLISNQGVTVKSISEDSVFKDSGLEPGCVIQTVDSEAIYTAADFYEKWRSGSVIEYTLNDEWFEIVVE